MNHWFNVLNIAGSAVLVAFGLFVWRVEPRNPRNRAFCLFALAFSLSTALANLETMLGLEGPMLSVEATVRGLLYGLGGAGAVWFAAATVEAPRRHIALAAGPGVVLLSLTAVWNGTEEPLTRYGGTVGAAVDLGFLLLITGAVFGVLLFAWAFREADRTPPARRELAYLSAALVMYPGYWLTDLAADFAAISMGEDGGFSLLMVLLALSAVATSLACVVAWVRNTRIPETSSTARNVALLAVGMGAVGLGLHVVETGVGDYGVPFLTRAGAVGILGYAILRGQMMGIDEKVEWGVSKTTVAGIFVAVFFVAGELAETFFGDVFGPYVGVIAAGALVFAISPLQRMADRFAERAVPGGSPAAGAQVEATYRRMVEKHLADGELTTEEAHELGQLASQLGIDPDRARRLREEAEAEGSDGA